MNIQLKWTVTSNGTDNKQQIQYKLKEDTKWIDYQLIDINVNEIVIENLKEDVVYDFRILSICKRRNNISSNIMTKVFFSCPKSDFEATTSSIIVTIEAKGDIDKYECILSNDQETTVYNTQTKTGPFGGQEPLTFIFEGLSSLTKYKYSINTYISAINASKVDCNKNVVFTL